jgi:hypothetical protein
MYIGRYEFSKAVAFDFLSERFYRWHDSVNIGSWFFVTGILYSEAQMICDSEWYLPNRNIVISADTRLFFRVKYL